MNRLVPLLLLGFLGCDEQSPRIALVDITQHTGPHFVTTSGAMPPTSIVEVNGPGVCLFDADSDGDIDIFIANGATVDDPDHGPGSRLFRNTLRETGTLTFVDVTKEAGIDLRRWATSATAVELTGDGATDLYVTCIGHDVLLRNDGHGHFTDITAEAGINVPGWSTCAAPGDIDGDKDIDLYIVRYIDWDFSSPPPQTVAFRGEQVISGPAGLPPQADVLLINNGNGTFRDINATINIPPAYGLNAVMLDVDGDTRLEVLVGNDGMSNNLLMLPQTDDPLFQDDAYARGFATNMSGAEQATMGLAVGDIDQSGTPDVISTNFSSDTNTLLVTDGMSFVDRTNVVGLGPPTRALLGWTTRLLDLDHDSDEDLLTLNGHVYPNATQDTIASEWRQPALVQRNDNGRFTAVRFDNGWLSERRVDRSAAFGDLDEDGDLDLVTAELNGPIRVIENRAAHPSRRGVVLDLSDESIAIGQHITIEVAGETHHRWHTPGTDFQGWSAPQIHLSVPREATTAHLTIGGSRRHLITLPN
jgi:hypothetical protein